MRRLGGHQAAAEADDGHVRLGHRRTRRLAVRPQVDDARPREGLALLEPRQEAARGADLDRIAQAVHVVGAGADEVLERFAVAGLGHVRRHRAAEGALFLTHLGLLFPITSWV